MFFVNVFVARPQRSGLDAVRDEAHREIDRSCACIEGAHAKEELFAGRVVLQLRNDSLDQRLCDSLPAM